MGQFSQPQGRSAAVAGEFGLEEVGFEDGGVDDIGGHFAAGDAGDRLEGADAVAEPAGVGEVEVVGGDDDVVEFEEGVVGTDGLVLKDINAGAGDLVGAESGGEGGLVDDGATGGVDEVGSGFHEIEFGGADEVAGLIVKRAVDGKEVGFAEESFEID